METIKTSLMRAQVKLRRSGISSAHLDSQILLETATGMNRAQLLAHTEETLTKDQQERFDQLIKQRISHQPIAYLTGHQEFYGLDFKVTKDVLIPRPETEAMVEQAIKLAPPNGSLIDVGTGCGCIAVSIAINRPDLAITATDISSKALGIARANAKQHQASVRFLKHDLFNQVAGQFDVICANLPYIPTDYPLPKSVRYEPRVALLGGPDGLDLYHKLLADANYHLKTAGYVMLEALDAQHPDLAKIAANAKLTLIKTDGLVLVFKSNR